MFSAHENYTSAQYLRDIYLTVCIDKIAKATLEWFRYCMVSHVILEITIRIAILSANGALVHRSQVNVCVPFHIRDRFEHFVTVFTFVWPLTVMFGHVRFVIGHTATHRTHVAFEFFATQFTIVYQWIVGKRCECRLKVDRFR